jgi:hypothetical protein
VNDRLSVGRDKSGHGQAGDETPHSCSLIIDSPGP